MRKALLILILLVPLALKAQQWGLAATGGYTIPNSARYSYIAGGSWGLDASVRWKTLGSEPWHRMWNYPSFGLRANYAHIPDGIAGDRIGLAGFLSTPLWKGESHGQIAVEFDLGLSLYTNPYQRTPNPANEMVGSYLNCLIQCGFEYRHPLPQGSALTLAAKFVHSSNGYLQKPNYGINFLQGELGYLLSCCTPYSLQTPVSEEEPLRDYLFLSYSPGLAQARGDDVHAPRHYCHTAQVGFMWRPREQFAWGFATELQYNYNERYYPQHATDPYPLPFFLGQTVAFEPYWGPLSLRLALGTYLLRSHQAKTILLPFYERVGTFYHFRNGLFAGVSMRLFAAHIDYIEWTAGYRIPLRTRTNN